jgi:hypothetical protein
VTNLEFVELGLLAEKIETKAVFFGVVWSSAT